VHLSREIKLDLAAINIIYKVPFTFLENCLMTFEAVRDWHLNNFV
jgi:hypothetical protein